MVKVFYLKKIFFKLSLCVERKTMGEKNKKHKERKTKRNLMPNISVVLTIF